PEHPWVEEVAERWERHGALVRSLVALVDGLGLPLSPASSRATLVRRLTWERRGDAVRLVRQEEPVWLLHQDEREARLLDERLAVRTVPLGLFAPGPGEEAAAGGPLPRIELRALDEEAWAWRREATAWGNARTAVRLAWLWQAGRRWSALRLFEGVRGDERDFAEALLQASWEGILIELGAGRPREELVLRIRRTIAALGEGVESYEARW